MLAEEAGAKAGGSALASSFGTISWRCFRCAASAVSGPDMPVEGAAGCACGCGLGAGVSVCALVHVGARLVDTRLRLRARAHTYRRVLGAEQHFVALLQFFPRRPAGVWKRVRQRAWPAPALLIHTRMRMCVQFVRVRAGQRARSPLREGRAPRGQPQPSALGCVRKSGRQRTGRGRKYRERAKGPAQHAPWRETPRARPHSAARSARRRRPLCLCPPSPAQMVGEGQPRTE